MTRATGAGRGRPSLGKRVDVTAKLPVTVREHADMRRKAHGIDLSPYLADLLCHYYSRPDLMRHLTQAMLDDKHPLSALTTDQIGHHQKIRVPTPVGDLIELDARERDVDRSALLADVICHQLGFPGLIRVLNKEVLLLAI